jgi:3-isopropylmalate/(R)-2-methylmalate dehydratase small subunit
MKNFNGKVLFLDRSDINTDEIIPARYLTELTKAALKPYLLEDLKLTGFNPKTDIDGKSVVVTRANFGCGSSREHAPWAFDENGIHCVIAENFARIFRQNMFNGGCMAVSLPADSIDGLFKKFSGKDTDMTLDFGSGKLTFKSGSATETLPFSIDEFDRELIKAGGWVEYADSRY